MFLYLAERFAEEDGIILELTPDASEDATEELPRYLPVKTLSCFEGEDEWLFGGKSAKFKIKSIHNKKVTKKIGNKFAVSALTKMQQLLQNGDPEWKPSELSLIDQYRNMPLTLMKTEEQTIRDDMLRSIRMMDNGASEAFSTFLAEHELDSDCIEYDVKEPEIKSNGNNDRIEYDVKKPKEWSNIYRILGGREDAVEEIKKYFIPPKNKELRGYKLELFKFFFMQTDIREIEIKNVYGLRDELRFLFFDDDNKLSLYPISRLLPMVHSVGFTNFELEDMRRRCTEFIKCIEKWLERCGSSSRKIDCIEFRSEYCEKPDDLTIKETVEQYSGDFREKHGWSLKYHWLGNHYHRIVAERTEEVDGQTAGYKVLTFELSLDADPEVLSSRAEKDIEEAIHELLELCGVSKRFYFDVHIPDDDKADYENENAIIKFKMEIQGENEKSDNDVEEILNILKHAEITRQMIQLDSLYIPVNSLKDCTDISLAGTEIQEKKALVAAEEKSKNIRNPLRVTAAEAGKPWTEQRQQSVLLRRKELQEQALQMMKNFMSNIESLLKANVIEWQQDVLEQVEQLRNRRSFRRYFRSMEMDEVKVKNFYNLREELQRLFLGDDQTLSLHFICDLLPKLRTVRFIDIPINEMKNHIGQFMDVIIKIRGDKRGASLKEVDFESGEVDDGTADEDIQREIEGHKRKLNEMRWSVKYKFNGQHHVISLREGGVNAIEAVGGIEEANKIAEKLKKDGSYNGKKLEAMTGQHYFQMSLGSKCLTLKRELKTKNVDESKEESNDQSKTATIHLTTELRTASTFLFEPCDGNSANGQYFIHGTYQQDEEKGLIMSNDTYLLGIFTIKKCVVNKDLWFCTIQKSGDQDGGFWIENEVENCVHYEMGLSASKDVFIMMEVDRPRHGCIMQ